MRHCGASGRLLLLFPTPFSQSRNTAQDVECKFHVVKDVVPKSWVNGKNYRFYLCPLSQ